MEQDTNFIEPLYQRVEEYGKVSYVLFKLKAVEKATGIVSSFVSKSSVLLVFLMFVGIVSIGGALWLGDLLGKSYYGFFCMAAFYALLAIVLHFFMQGIIKKRVMNSIIAHMLN